MRYGLGALAVVSLGASLLAIACSSPSAPALTSDSNTAAVSLSSLAATVDTIGLDAVYHLSFQLKETGGRSGATVTGMTLTLQKGTATFVATHTFATTERLSAGGSLEVGPLKHRRSCRRVGPDGF